MGQSDTGMLRAGRTGRIRRGAYVPQPGVGAVPPAAAGHGGGVACRPGQAAAAARAPVHHRATAGRAAPVQQKCGLAAQAVLPTKLLSLVVNGHANAISHDHIIFSSSIPADLYVSKKPTNPRNLRGCICLGAPWKV